MKKWRNNLIRGQCIFLLFVFAIMGVGCQAAEASFADGGINNSVSINKTDIKLDLGAESSISREEVSVNSENKEIAATRPSHGIKLLKQVEFDDDDITFEDTETPITPNPSETVIPSDNSNSSTGVTEDPEEPEDIPSEHIHNYKVIKTVAPSCIEDGYSVYKCSCGDLYNDNIVTAAGHSWGEWIIKKEPTSSEEGLQSRSCSVCGSSEEQIVEKISVPNITLDYAAAESYGNQYAASTYGWYIDTSLNSGNAGYYPASTTSVYQVNESGGQDYLNRKVADKVNSLRSNLADRGVTGIPYINCDVYDDGNGKIFILVYYG